MATYVNDLRLKEIGTGESAGTWGTETNVNLELIGEALSFGTESITTNADTHTSTVADGSTDPARSMFIKYTGTLDSACTITIAPNTLSRVHLIENGTSGSQNIIISQGSGANVTIPPGDVKAVYLDGAGSGAAVVDAFASLNVVDLKVEDDLTVTDDLIVNGDIDLEGSIDVNGTANLDVVDIDGAVDMASTLSVGGLLTVAAKARLTDVGNATVAALQFTDAGLGISSPSTDQLNFITADTTRSVIDSSGNFFVSTTEANPHTLSSGGGTKFFNSSGTFLAVARDSQTVIGANRTGSSAGTVIDFRLDGTVKGDIGVESTGMTINDGSADLDFRIESDSNTHMLFVDAGSNTVSIGSSVSDGTLHVESGSAGTITSAAAANELVLESDGPVGMSLLFDDEANDAYGNIYWGNETDGNADGRITYFGSTYVSAGDRQVMSFRTAGTERMRIKSGKVSIGTTAVASATSASLHVADPSVDVQAVFGDNLASIDDPQIRVIGRDSANSAIRYLFTGLDADANNGFIGYNAGSGSFVNALTFDTSGQVGIGRVPNANLDIQGSASGTLSALRIRNDGQVAGNEVKMIFSLNRDGSDVDFECAGIVAGKEQNWTTTASTVDGFLAFRTIQDETASEKMRISSSGRLTTQADIVPGADVIMSNGRGISFSATTDGTTMTSELLDDYEEGTFDATIISDSGSITVDTSDNLCFYTKIGRLVTVSGRISPSSVSSPSGQLYVGNLPFALASAGETSHAGAVACNIYNAASNFGGEVVAEMTTTGSARILIRGNGGTTSAVHAAAANIDSGSLIGFTATYPST